MIKRRNIATCAIPCRCSVARDGLHRILSYGTEERTGFTAEKTKLYSCFHWTRKNKKQDHKEERKAEEAEVMMHQSNGRRASTRCGRTAASHWEVMVCWKKQRRRARMHLSMPWSRTLSLIFVVLYSFFLPRVFLEHSRMEEQCPAGVQATLSSADLCRLLSSAS